LKNKNAQLCVAQTPAGKLPKNKRPGPKSSKIKMLNFVWHKLLPSNRQTTKKQTPGSEIIQNHLLCREKQAVCIEKSKNSKALRMFIIEEV
jgi:hypothetical protein